MEKPFNFPEVRNYIECHHVNGTPDGEYALRILEHYRQCCDTVWKVDGLSKNERVIYEYVNYHRLKPVACRYSLSTGLYNLMRTNTAHSQAVFVPVG